MGKISLNVDGIECCGCENRIKSALNDIKGITNVEASHENKTVSFEIKEDDEDNENVSFQNASIDKVKMTINDLGFKVLD